MATVVFFSIILSTRFLIDSHAFKIDSSYILFHSPSIAVLSESIFGWEVDFVLLSQTLYVA